MLGTIGKEVQPDNTAMLCNVAAAVYLQKRVRSTAGTRASGLDFCISYTATKEE